MHMTKAFYIYFDTNAIKHSSRSEEKKSKTTGSVSISDFYRVRLYPNGRNRSLESVCDTLYEALNVKVWTFHRNPEVKVRQDQLPSREDICLLPEEKLIFLITFRCVS